MYNIEKYNKYTINIFNVERQNIEKNKNIYIKDILNIRNKINKLKIKFNTEHDVSVLLNIC